MSTTSNDDQLAREAMEELARANPATPGAIDTNADALLERIVRFQPSPTSPHWPKRVVVAAGGLAAVALVALASFVLLGGGGADDGDEQVPADGAAGGGQGGDVAGSCLAYSDDELLRREFAFRGRATEVAGKTVTFDVVEWYAGDRGQTVTLELDSTLQSELYRDFAFEQGAEYLVSGDGEVAWGCGFSRPYDGRLAASWSALLEGGGSQVNSGNSAASCAFAYSAETLVQRDHAFDGVLVSVGEGTGPGGIEYPELTFEVRESFNGVDSGAVTLLGSGLDYGYETGPEPVMEVGGRYLVAGDEQFAWGCGFTRNYSDTDADTWRGAFGR